MKHQFIFWSVLFVLFLSGCGKNMPLSGKITFDDGTPLTSGTIVFQCDKTLSRGIIQEDGTYVVGTEKSRNGIPKGKEFSVSITGAYEPLPPDAGMVVPVPLVDPKYNTPETSGLTFNSDGKTKTFDFVVERPDQAFVNKVKKDMKKIPNKPKDLGPGARTALPATRK